MERVPRRRREAAPSRRDDYVIQGDAEPLSGDMLEPQQHDAEPADSEGSAPYAEAEPLTGAPAEETTAPSFASSAPTAPADIASADEAEAGTVHEAAAEQAEDDGATASALEDAELSTSAADFGEGALTTEARSVGGNGEDEEAVEDFVESVGGADALEGSPIVPRAFAGNTRSRK